MAYTKKTKELIDGLKKEIEELNKTVNVLEDSLQNLTLKYKYVEFDNEATKREINYYKKLLEDKNE